MIKPAFCGTKLINKVELERIMKKGLYNIPGWFDCA